MIKMMILKNKLLIPNTMDMSQAGSSIEVSTPMSRPKTHRLTKIKPLNNVPSVIYARKV